MIHGSNDNASKGTMRRVLHVTIVMFRTRRGAISRQRIRSRIRVVILFPSRIKIKSDEFVEARASRVTLSREVRSRVTVRET